MKFMALREYELIEGRLHTKVGLGARGAKVQRYVPRDEEVFDIVTRAHLGLLHPGQLKTFQEIERTTAGISRKEVTELLKHCPTCSKKALQKSTAPIKVIVENVLWGRVQIDLIDMRGDPDERFQWICHLRDHFSKYSVAFPMPNKTSEEVVKVVLAWIMHLGPPKILQSDNGTEFKGALTILLRQYGIQVINGRPCHPQSQGMVEKANHILKDKIAAWRCDHQTSSWVSSLPEVIAGMNSQQSSVTGRSPYEIVFGQEPHGTRISYLERDVEEVPEEGEQSLAAGPSLVNRFVVEDAGTGHVEQGIVHYFFITTFTTVNNCKETLPASEYEEPAGGQLLAEVDEEVHMATSGVARLVDLDTQDLGIYRTLSKSQNE